MRGGVIFRVEGLASTRTPNSKHYTLKPILAIVSVNQGAEGFGVRGEGLGVWFLIWSFGVGVLIWL